MKYTMPYILDLLFRNTEKAKRVEQTTCATFRAFVESHVHKYPEGGYDKSYFADKSTLDFWKNNLDAMNSCFAQTSYEMYKKFNKPFHLAHVIIIRHHKTFDPNSTYVRRDDGVYRSWDTPSGNKELNKDKLKSLDEIRFSGSNHPDHWVALVIGSKKD